jgi:hypothetical protein
LDEPSVEKLEMTKPLWQDKPVAERPRWLELLASVLFLERSYDGRNKDAAGLREILARNDKHFSEDEVRRALEELARYGLSSQSAN